MKLHEIFLFVNTTLIIAHRGFSGKYYENTLLSFLKAIDLGVDWIETDVHLIFTDYPDKLKQVLAEKPKSRRIKLRIKLLKKLPKIKSK